ncbi:hypothetical protein B0H66DRAFT_538590 [Apodospora peruviana]|uniref:2EXR domain-containing protein n=1 Tax=Apodospora peruviana TaxID=516989 RepID=A0AAE0HTA4_9PEZI|nr:hypothetical protein B0H66DRAFT_538590 [Apodospora peruviana]
MTIFPVPTDSSSAPKTFHSFQKLPNEIQNMIWELVPTPTRVVTGDVRLPIVPAKFAIPPLMHVCSTSRFSGKRRFTLLAKPNSAPRTPYIEYRGLKRAGRPNARIYEQTREHRRMFMYIDYETDVFVAGWDTMIPATMAPMTRFISVPDPTQVRNLAYLLPSRTAMRYAADTLLDVKLPDTKTHCPNLRKAVMLVCERETVQPFVPTYQRDEAYHTEKSFSSSAVLWGNGNMYELEAVLTLWEQDVEYERQLEVLGERYGDGGKNKRPVFPETVLPSRSQFWRANEKGEEVRMRMEESVWLTDGLFFQIGSTGEENWFGCYYTSSRYYTGKNVVDRATARRDHILFAN